MKSEAIVTHFRPHLDEMFAIWVMRKFGEQMFPGIAKAPVIFWNAGVDTPDGRSAKEWSEDGFVCIGVGGGAFDEHPNIGDGKVRAQNECAATLVVQALGLEENASIKRVLDYVMKCDTKNMHDHFGVAATIRAMFDESIPFDDVYRWTEMWIDTQYRAAVAFNEKGAAEFKQSTQVYQFMCNGRSLNLAAILSDDDKVGAYARSKLGCSAAVVIQRRSNGHVFIGPVDWLVHKEKKSMEPVIARLRFAELAKRDAVLPLEKIAGVAAEGTLPEVPEWYYQKATGLCMNGSKTNTSAPRTQITMEELTALVIEALKDP